MSWIPKRKETMRRALMGVLGLLATAGLLTTATAAHATGNAANITAAESGDITPQWFGAEHVTVNTATNWGGWVDGNGPDSYQAVGVCNNGTVRRGEVRWAGDRRGSFVYCSSGFAGRYFAKLYA